MRFKEIDHDDVAERPVSPLLPRRRASANHFRGDPLAVWADLPVVREDRHGFRARRQVHGAWLVLVLGMPRQVHGARQQCPRAFAHSIAQVDARVPALHRIEEGLLGASAHADDRPWFLSHRVVHGASHSRGNGRRQR